MNNRYRSRKKMDGQISRHRQQKSSIGEPILKTKKSSKPINPISQLKEVEETLKTKKANKVSFINYSNLYIGLLSIPLISLIFLK